MKALVNELNEYAQHKKLPSSLVSLVTSLVSCCLDINQRVRLGQLSGVLGEAGTGNVQGEQQKKLDVIANNLLIDKLSKLPIVAGLASEEEEHFLPVAEGGEYLVLFDPLDGSSNVDVNISIGTIFSILDNPGGQLSEAHFLQPGVYQRAAGYVLYGPQTVLVLSFGAEVLMFTLNEQGDFVLTQNKLHVPQATQEFAINVSNYRYWQSAMRQYVDELLEGEEGIRKKNYNLRWVASMVAEVHRILTRGGIFLYPKDTRPAATNGKLRLLYEANPMSFLITAAGGRASNLEGDILQIEPKMLHQRVPVVLGSSEEVLYVQRLHL
ncbi:MAG: class 1 fructose-bisphosphatase [Neisseriaceae bacterium]